MKRILTTIAAIAAVHFALMYFTGVMTVGNNIHRSFTFFGTPPPDTWLTRLVSSTNAILREPIVFFVSLLPATGAEDAKIHDPHLYVDLLFYALNSFSWGGVIYLVSYGFRHRFRREQAA
ncbi:MAG TPA: hypothetical protein VI454_21120 [Verrucomicrobiae bacterium]|jgi:hypothetical protein